MDSLLAALGPTTTTPLGEIALRLIAAVVAGAVLGIDRELKRKPAGLRTHMLVSLAAASFTVLTFEMFRTADAMDENSSTDPLRVTEAVVAGVAFLGGGAIIRGGGDIRGLTTGANIWLAGALGVACGAGYLAVAMLCLGLSVLVLIAISWVERRLLDTKPD